MYFKCPSLAKRSGTALVLFYAVSLLYVLSTATFVSNLIALILFVTILSVKMPFFIAQPRVGTLSPQL